MLRGDDVAELQQRLAALGFDPGRVDGIFGPTTAPRVTPRHPELSLVSVVRDRERLLRGPRTLLRRRIALAEPGGLDALAAAVRRRLARRGALVVPILHPDGSVQAAMANRAEVDVFLGLRLEPTAAHCTCAYYAGYRYVSPGGQRLAEMVARAIDETLELVEATAVVGMSVPVLRETQMPAVRCELGPADLLVARLAEVAEALAGALEAWAAAPV
ncbi:peptidoglycan-binding protein [Aciditerrimonas ferrireducens]|uniref:peptidoglycan-binding protein n=1 Tax=Aciditerrimonas ferrireducens TaxID=667306 RepID=UPI002005ABCC|nr:peptidoglycan-binding protein [Aciditerrimonas ferrireducens]MCK4176981.1 peptidoglycan-binding protein [Aciditerrimonas ferrireducens]